MKLAIPTTPISPPSGPTQWLFQGPPAESKFLAVAVYPGRPEWTEVYDLKHDPYELQNLPADGPLGMSLQAELEKQMTAVGFKPGGKCCV